MLKNLTKMQMFRVVAVVFVTAGCIYWTLHSLLPFALHANTVSHVKRNSGLLWGAVMKYTETHRHIPQDIDELVKAKPEPFPHENPVTHGNDWVATRTVAKFSEAVDYASHAAPGQSTYCPLADGSNFYIFSTDEAGKLIPANSASNTPYYYDNRRPN